jgi:lipoic acid synthetase
MTERKLLRLEVKNAETPIERKPEWIKTRLRTGPEYTAVRSLVEREGLHTVCQEAGCPNIYECWEDREATFLIGGEQCTRRCDFCQIDTGKPAPLDRDEPRRVAGVLEVHGVAGLADVEVRRVGEPALRPELRKTHLERLHRGVVPDEGRDDEHVEQCFDQCFDERLIQQHLEG